MTKYYGVEQKYYNNGKIDVKLIEKYANAKPLDIQKENIDSDYYVDWFVNKEYANFSSKWRCILFRYLLYSR